MNSSIKAIFIKPWSNYKKGDKITPVKFEHSSWCGLTENGERIPLEYCKPERQKQ